MARIEPVRGINNNPNPKQNNTPNNQRGRNKQNDPGAKGPSIFTPEGRKVYGDTEGPLPKIIVRQPDVQVIEDPAQMTLQGGISYLNHPEYKGMVDKPTLDENQVPNAEKGLMESIPTLFDPGGLVTGATNSYLVNRGLKTPAEAVLEQSIATSLGGAPIIGALAKKSPAVRNTVKQIPFSDQTVLGTIKNKLFNKPRFVKDVVNGVPSNTPSINVKGQDTFHNSAWLNGTEYPSTKERDKELVDIAKKIGYKEEQLLDADGKVKPEVFLNKEFEGIMGRPHKKEFAVAYRPGTEGFKGRGLDDSYAGTGLDNLNGEVTPGELYGHNYVGVYGLPNDPSLNYPSNPREVWQYVSGDETGTEGIFKIPQTKYFGNNEEILLNQSPEVQNGIRELMAERGYKPSDMLAVKDQKYSDVLQTVMDETGVSPDDINRYMANRYGILGNMSPWDSFGGAYPQASIGRDIDTELFRQKLVEPYEMEDRFLRARRYLRNKRGNQ